MQISILLTLALAAAPAAAPASRLPFIDDDYQHARAEAGRRQLPLFVEVWAPW